MAQLRQPGAAGLTPREEPPGAGSPGTPPAPAEPLSQGGKSHGAQVLAHRAAGSTCREWRPGGPVGVADVGAPGAWGLPCTTTQPLPFPGTQGPSPAVRPPTRAPPRAPSLAPTPAPWPPSLQTALIPPPPAHFSTSGGLSPAPPAWASPGPPREQPLPLPQEQGARSCVLEGPGVCLGGDPL